VRDRLQSFHSVIAFRIVSLYAGDSGHMEVAFGLLALLVIEALNLYKPRDMTSYGRRKQQEQRTVSQALNAHITDSDGRIVEVD